MDIQTLTDDELRLLATRLRPFLEEIVRETVKEETEDNSNKQLVAMTSATMDLITQQTDQVYNDIVQEINTTVIPKINAVTAFTQYTFMDEPEYTTSFRRAAFTQDKALQITDGTESKDRFIGKYVEKVFTEDEY